MAKKVLSLFMSLAMICAFITIPAVATDTTSLSFELRNEKWNGRTYTVEVVAAGPETFAAAAAQCTLQFDPEVLVCQSVEMFNNGDGPFASSDCNKTENAVKFIGVASRNKTFTGKIDLLKITFTIKDGVTEAQTTKLWFDEDPSSLLLSVLDDDGVTTLQHRVTADEHTVNVPGTAPALKEVTPTTSEAAIDGTEDKTVKFTAKSSRDADISGNVSWEITEGKGVTIANDGTVTVKKNAEGKTYTVTATPKDATVSGTAKTATLTVTRAAAQVAEIKITTESLPKPIAADIPVTLTAEVTDQYGEVMNPSITWTAAAGTLNAEHFALADNVLTVKVGADDGQTVTVTAKAGSKTVSKTLTVKAEPSKATAIEITGDTTIAVPTKAVGSASIQLTVAVKDQYSQTMDDETVIWSGGAAGVSVDAAGKVTVKNTAVAGQVTLTATSKTDSAVKKEVTITVTKDAPVLTELEIRVKGGTTPVTKPHKNAKEDSFTYDCSVVAYDQFGAVMPEQTATFSLDVPDKGVTLENGNQLVVTKAAEDGVKLIAQVGGKTVELPLTFKESSVSQVNPPVGPTGETKPGTTEPGTTEPGTEPSQPGAVSSIFTDLANGHWAVNNGAIQYVYDNKLMTGASATSFAPNATTTRAQIFVILARRAGMDTEGGSIWYQKGLDWATTNNVSDGSAPNSYITREQLVTMLYRLIGSPEVTGTLTAPDASAVSDWAVNGMLWATQNGIIKGNEAGALNPTGNATRAEVATILMSFCQQYPVQG